MERRDGMEVKFVFPAGASETDPINLQHGCFGTVLVPPGSQLIGRTLQFVAVPMEEPGKYPETALLSTPITLAAGANALTVDEIRECGAVSGCRLRINTPVTAESFLVLLWKS